MSKITAVIKERKLIDEDVYEIVFTCRSESLVFKAGQHVEIILLNPIYKDNRGNSRVFSIASSPSKNKEIKVIFTVSSSAFKKSLISLPVGSEVVIVGPAGGFVLSENTNDKDYVFIADRIGISPFLSILRQAVELKSETPITLFYLSSGKGGHICLTELQSIAEVHKNFELKIISEFVHTDLFTTSVHDLFDKDWYIAGSHELVINATDILRKIGILDNRVFKEVMSTKYLNAAGLLTKPSDTDKFNKKAEQLFFDGSNIKAVQILKILSETAMVTVTDADGVILYVNDFFTKITKYSKEEMIGRTHRVLNAGFHPSSFYKEMWDTIKGGKSWRGEIKNKAKDGKYYWVDTSVSPLFGADGIIKNFIAVRFLVTDRKEAEDQLIDRTVDLQKTVVKLREREAENEKVKKVTLSILEDLDQEKKAVERKIEERTMAIEYEKDKLLQITENMNDGAVLLDRGGVVVFANSRLYELLGIDKADKVSCNNLNFETIKKYFNDQGIEELFKKCLDNKASYLPEVEVRGRIYEMFSHCTGYNDGSEEVDGCFILISDITDVKLIERTKSDLVAVASHQLRTPLTAIRGNLEMLRDESFGDLGEQQQEMLSDIEVSTTRLIGMVNDMLDITKIEHGELDMVYEPVVLVDILKSIITDFSDYTKRHNVIISLAVPEDVVAYVDATRTRRVLQNILDNAIKYSSSPGNIDVSCRTSSNFIEIIIKDDGIGIPEAEQEKIFSRFYRASNTADSLSGGSGLGLYIVRSIVSQLGGSIFFESEEGVGTTFFITFPAAKIDGEED